MSLVTHSSVNLTLIKGRTCSFTHRVLSKYFIFGGGEGRGEVGAADVHEDLLSFGCFVKIGSAKAILT